jgi:hypothetical protein
MHKSGALLLEASDGDALDVHLRALQPPGPSPSHTQALLGAPHPPLPCGQNKAPCACCLGRDERRNSGPLNLL